MTFARLTDRHGLRSLGARALLALALAAGCAPSGDRYLVPEGYVGWVCVAFAVEGASPLGRENGLRLVTVPKGGYVETSEPGGRGTRTVEEYVFVGAGGARRPAHASGGFWVPAGADTPARWCAFVGTAEEAGRSKDAPRDADGVPLPGHLTESPRATRP